MANAIELKDIKKGFAGVQALKGVSFAIKKGKRACAYRGKRRWEINADEDTVRRAA